MNSPTVWTLGLGVLVALAGSNSGRGDCLADAGARRLAVHFDGNGNGLLEPAELRRLPRPMAAWLERHEVDRTDEIARPDFERLLTSMLRELRHERRPPAVRASDRAPDRNPEPTPSISAEWEALQEAVPEAAELTDQSGLLEQADHDGDGQIDYREWRTSNEDTGWSAGTFADFRVLDEDRNGLLTFWELDPGRKRYASLEREPEKQPEKSEEQQRAERRGRWVFGQLDRDDDGEVSDEEWERSQSTRAMFERAEIELRTPAEEDDFTEQYLEAQEEAGSSGGPSFRFGGRGGSFGGGRRGGFGRGRFGGGRGR